MARTYRQAVLAGAALVACTALLTACQDDGSGTSGAATPDNAAASQAPQAEDGGGQGTGGAADAASSEPSQAKEEERSGGDTAQEAKSGKGVSGTWLGTVAYLAPGKYTVNGWKDQQQQFWLAEDTEIWGTGDICGDENGQAAEKCTEAELEAAAKKGVSAEVVVKDGIAVSITDDH